MFGCQRNHSGGCILNMLKPLDSFFRQSIQKWTTEVQSGSNESVQKYFCCMATDIFPYTADILKVEEALHTAVTWCSIDMTVSYRTLIFLAVDGGGGRWLAFKTTGSVFSLFILSMFTIIQASISRTQSSIANLATSEVDELRIIGIKMEIIFMVSHYITQGSGIEQE